MSEFSVKTFITIHLIFNLLFLLRLKMPLLNIFKILNSISAFYQFIIYLILSILFIYLTIYYIIYLPFKNNKPLGWTKMTICYFNLGISLLIVVFIIANILGFFHEL